VGGLGRFPEKFESQASLIVTSSWLWKKIFLWPIKRQELALFFLRKKPLQIFSAGGTKKKKKTFLGAGCWIFGGTVPFTFFFTIFLDLECSGAFGELDFCHPPLGFLVPWKEPSSATLHLTWFN